MELVLSAKDVLEKNDSKSKVIMGHNINKYLVTGNGCCARGFIKDFCIHDKHLLKLVTDCHACVDCYNRMAKIIVTSSNKIKVV